MPKPVQDADCGLRRRAPCRGGVREAQARSGQSGSDGAPRPAGGAEMSDQENFLTRWSRRKLEPADEKVPAEPPQAADAPPAGEEAAKPAGCGARRSGAGAGIRPQQAAFARFDRRRFRHHGRSCKRACHRRSGMRRFAARGRPIRRSAITSGRTKISGKASEWTTYRGLARSIRASTSRNLSPKSLAMRNRCRAPMTPRRQKRTFLLL